MKIDHGPPKNRVRKCRYRACSNRNRLHCCHPQWGNSLKGVPYSVRVREDEFDAFPDFCPLPDSEPEPEKEKDGS